MSPPSRENPIWGRANPVCGLYRAEKYPAEWKDCCRDVLRAYKEHQRKKLGLKQFGWGRVRNQIIEVSAPKEGLDSSLLVAQDLQHWDKSDPDSLGDNKFSYVDFFIRKSIIDGADELSEVRSEIISYRSKENLKSVYRFVNGWNKQPDQYELKIMNDFEQRIFAIREKDVHDDRARCAIYIKPTRNAAYETIIFFSDDSPRLVTDLVSYGYKIFGCLIPIGVPGEPESAKVLGAVMYEIDRLRLRTSPIMGASGAHAYLSSEDMTLKLVDLVASPSPGQLWRLNEDQNLPHHARFDVQLPDGDKGSHWVGFEFKPIPISIDMSDYLNNLKNEYLLW